MIAITAVDLFERNGFSATTIDDIATAAGISRTTFFRHCATKEAAVLVDDAGLESELITVWPQHLADIETRTGLIKILPFELAKTERPLGVWWRTEPGLSPAAQLIVEALKTVSAAEADNRSDRASGRR